MGWQLRSVSLWKQLLVPQGGPRPSPGACCPEWGGVKSTTKGQRSCSFLRLWRPASPFLQWHGRERDLLATCRVFPASRPLLRFLTWRIALHFESEKSPVGKSGHETCQGLCQASCPSGVNDRTLARPSESGLPLPVPFSACSQVCPAIAFVMVRLHCNGFLLPSRPPFPHGETS